jgi:hypothetical protein
MKLVFAAFVAVLILVFCASNAVGQLDLNKTHSFDDQIPDVASLGHQLSGVTSTDDCNCTHVQVSNKSLAEIKAMDNQTGNHLPTTMPTVSEIRAQAVGVSSSESPDWISIRRSDLEALIGYINHPRVTGPTSLESVAINNLTMAVRG